jgi:hypothetical protein
LQYEQYGDTRVLQLLWAAVSDNREGVELLMECGGDAVAAHAWLKSFDLMQQYDFPRPHDSKRMSPANRGSSAKDRRSAMVVAYSTMSAIQGMGILTNCVQNVGNAVHRPAVAQLHASEVFATPQASDIRWTARVRGVAMQVRRLWPLPSQCATVTLLAAWVV